MPSARNIKSEKIIAWLSRDPFAKRLERESILNGISSRGVCSLHHSLNRSGWWLQNNLSLSISPANYHSWTTFNDLISVVISARYSRSLPSLAFGSCTITQIAELFLGSAEHYRRAPSGFTDRYVYIPSAPLSAHPLTVRILEFHEPSFLAKRAALSFAEFPSPRFAFTIFYRRPQIARDLWYLSWDEHPELKELLRARRTN